VASRNLLLSFEEKLNVWKPDEMYFQEENDRPPVTKEKLLRKIFSLKMESKVITLQ